MRFIIITLFSWFYFFSKLHNYDRRLLQMTLLFVFLIYLLDILLLYPGVVGNLQKMNVIFLEFLSFR